MRIVAFSDYRVQDVSSLYKFLRKLKPKPDVIIYAGDDVANFESDFPEFDPPEFDFRGLGRCSNYGVVAVLGNDDSPEDKNIFRTQDVTDLHNNAIGVNEYIFIGQEGGLRNFPIGHILYSEGEIEKHLLRQLKATKNKKFKHKKIVLVSHNPPFGVLDYAMRHSSEHIGSKAIKKLILQYRQVILNICGHVHSRGGQAEKLGNAFGVNVASHDKPGSPGRIAIIDLKRGKVEKIEFKEIWDSVLMSINGIGDYCADILERIGIETIKDLAEQTPAVLCKKLEKFNLRLPYVTDMKALAERWIMAAKSSMNNKPYLIKPFKFHTEGTAYIDIELGGGIGIFLIGLYDPSEGSAKQFIAYKATKKEAKRILEEFLNFLKEKNYRQLYCFGGISNFDFNFLRSDIEELQVNKEKYQFAIQQIKKGKNIYHELHKYVVIPSKSFGIKEVASSLGFKFRHPEIDWTNIGEYYQNYLENDDNNILRRILEYNEDDVLAINYVISKLKKLTPP